MLILYWVLIEIIGVIVINEFLSIIGRLILNYLFVYVCSSVVSLYVSKLMVIR